MSKLPIHKLTLYKQGIGYFERRGEIEGNTVSLVVPLENINDTLKSLTIVSHNGGQVFGVDYETPADREKVLQDLSVRLANRSSLVDLLASLRGSRVSLKLENEQIATGRLIGVETSLETNQQPATVILQANDNTADIQVLPVSKLLGLTLHDDRMANDVSFFLDVSQTEQTRTTITVRLSAGKHDLEIGYLSPCPTWRVSYQLVSNGHNQARLMGWGLFDNFLEEDLDDVSLTLKSGRPISFEYDLYKARVPSRPHVADDSTAMEEMSGNPIVVESISSLSHDLRTPLTSMMGYADLLDKTGHLDNKQREFVNVIRQNGQRTLELITNLLDYARLNESDHSTDVNYMGPSVYRSGPLGNLKVSGAYFMPMLIGNAEPELLTYNVETPVSVRRNQSAMVPIINHNITFKEICVYNGDKMKNHPLLVWRLQNDTGKALEQGPVTLVKNGEYLGEGLMQFTGMGDDIHIPYALEFGILATEKTADGDKGIFEVKFDSKKQKARLRQYEITKYNYTLTSHVEREITVLIERRDPTVGLYYQMPTPDLATEGHTRWPVVVPANEKAYFTVQIRRVVKLDQDITHWTTDFVQGLHKNDLLTNEVYAQFKELWREQEEQNKASAEQNTLKSEYEQLLSRQQQLRQNLGALGKSDREAAIRDQILDDLESSENRRRELETEIANLDEKIKQHRDSQQSLIIEIYSS